MKTRAIVLTVALLIPRIPAHVSEAPRASVTAAAVESIGMTVSDMDRAIDFYTSVLTFEKAFDRELSGREYAGSVRRCCGAHQGSRRPRPQARRETRRRLRHPTTRTTRAATRRPRCNAKIQEDTQWFAS
jgi:hypothetical protein